MLLQFCAESMTGNARVTLYVRSLLNSFSLQAIEQDTFTFMFLCDYNSKAVDHKICPYGIEL